MSTKKKPSCEESSLRRHRAHRSICKHSECEEIEREFVSWTSIKNIVDRFDLRDRFALYRHAHAMELFVRRGRNLQLALGRFIEQADSVECI